jgi:hypothetical protein
MRQQEVSFGGDDEAGTPRDQGCRSLLVSAASTRIRERSRASPTSGLGRHGLLAEPLLVFFRKGSRNSARLEHLMVFD